MNDKRNVLKKFAIALVALLFAGSVYVGFRAAAKMSQRFEPVVSNGENTPTASQQNYLLFHVSDLNSESPFLVSVWGLFINYVESPHLAFVSLYPPADDGEVDWMPGTFRLRPDASLPGRLISQIERKYKINTSGYILVDNFAVSSLEAWLGQRSVTLPQEKPESVREFQSILSNGESFFSNICEQVKINSLKPVLEQIHWTVLLPEHFSTDLSFEKMILAVDGLTSAEKIGNCKVFVSQ